VSEVGPELVQGRGNLDRSICDSRHRRRRDLVEEGVDVIVVFDGRNKSVLIVRVARMLMQHGGCDNVGVVPGPTFTMGERRVLPAESPALDVGSSGSTRVGSVYGPPPCPSPVDAGIVRGLWSGVHRQCR